MEGEDQRQKNYCSQVPSLISAFVDTFVDYVVGKQFLHSHLGESSNSLDKSDDATQKDSTALSENEERKDGPDTLTRMPAPERLIAIGDLHGDLQKAKRALLIAEVMDVKEQWIGGRTVVVQVGDLLDRGGDEIKIIYLLEKLKREAQREGGDVHIMNGNHEVMNVEANFRYATSEGIAEFSRWADWYKMGNVLKERCNGLDKPYDFFKNIPEVVDCTLSDGCKARTAALRPGGPISSRFLAPHPMVLVIGATVFVHGGLSPSHIKYGLDKINRETKEWLQGKNEFKGPKFLRGGESSLVWARDYSNENENMCDCAKLEKMLDAIVGAKRMVMGHTVQGSGINAVCSDKAVRVDTGMSQGMNDGPPEVLEIFKDSKMTVLSARPIVKMMDEKDKSSYSLRASGGSGLASLLSPTRAIVRVPINLGATPNL